MSSILTNASALSAVANLNATQKSLATVQNEISTGLKVSSAQDNAAYFSIAATLRTGVSNLGAVSDSLNLGSSVVGTATAALTGVTSTLQSIQADLISAKQPGTDLTSIGTDIAALQKQLTSAVQSASFNGVNLLDGSQVATASGGTGAATATGTANFVASVTGSGAATTVNSIDIDATKTNFGAGTSSGFNVAYTGTNFGSDTSIDISGASTASTANALSVSTTTTSAQLADYISAVGQALTNVNTASENLGAAAKTISAQSTFTSSLSDSLTTGVGSLVDADLNEASTRLNALQTQQQLGVQALSVANQNSQLILKLFGG